MKSGYKVPEGDELVEVAVEVNGKFLDPVVLQIRQPQHSAGRFGFIFAPFAANPAYHGSPVQEWQGIAKSAIQRYGGQIGVLIQGEIKPEYLQPLNMMAEYA